MFFLYFVGILCMSLGFFFLGWSAASSEEEKFHSLRCGILLVVFGACVVFSTKLAAALL